MHAHLNSIARKYNLVLWNTMCRLTAYLGYPTLAAEIVTRPARSVIRQSFDARERLGGSGGQVYNYHIYVFNGLLCWCIMRHHWHLFILQKHIND